MALCRRAGGPSGGGGHAPGGASGRGVAGTLRLQRVVAVPEGRRRTDGGRPGGRWLVGGCELSTPERAARRHLANAGGSGWRAPVETRRRDLATSDGWHPTRGGGRSHPRMPDSDGLTWDRAPRRVVLLRHDQRCEPGRDRTAPSGATDRTVGAGRAVRGGQLERLTGRRRGRQTAADCRLF